MFSEYRQGQNIPYSSLSIYFLGKVGIVNTCSACLYLPKIVLVSNHLAVSDRNVHRKTRIASQRRAVPWLQVSAGWCVPPGLGRACLSPRFPRLPLSPCRIYSLCSRGSVSGRLFTSSSSESLPDSSRLPLPLQFSVRREDMFSREF